MMQASLARLLGAPLLSLAVLTGATAPPASAQEKGGEAVFMSIEIPSLNPLHASSATGLVSPNLYATLVRLDDAWAPQPYLASAWELSDDGLTYTFHLEPGATFQDGEPITSEDVKWSLETAREQHRFGPTMFGSIETIDTPDPETAVFHLSQPSPALLRSASSPRFLPIMPKHVFDDGQDFMTHPAHEQPVGSGPFKLTDNGLPSYLVLEPSETFWGEGPYLERLIYRVVTDQTAVRVGFEREEFHIAMGSATSLYRDMKRYQELPHIAVDPCCDAVGSIFAMDINNREAPLDDAKVRRAIALAIDWDFMTEKLHSGWTKIPTGPIVSASPYADPDASPMQYDPEQAMALLDEAGYPAGDDGTRFELSLIHLSSYRDLMVTVGEYLVPQLAKVGIKINREQMPDSASWSKRTGDWDYDLALALPGNFHDPTVGVSRLYVCDNIKHVAYTNTSGYCNPKVDELFAAAAIEPDEEKRKALYFEVGKILREDMPMIWVVESPAPLIHDIRLKDMPIEAWGPYGPLDKVWWDAEATK